MVGFFNNSDRNGFGRQVLAALTETDVGRRILAAVTETDVGRRILASVTETDVGRRIKNDSRRCYRKNNIFK